MNRPCICIALVAQALVFSDLAPAENFAVELRIENNQPFARVEEPLSFGVPVPESLGLFDTRTLRVTDSQGRSVDTQFDVLGRWKAGPADTAAAIRWILVHFKANVPAEQTSLYTLRNDGSGSAAERISSTQQSNQIEIATGPARFLISRTSFNLFDGVWLDLNDNSVFEDAEQIVSSSADNGSYVVQGSTEYKSVQPGLSPTAVVLEENGPLRVVVRAEGFHQNAQGQKLLRYVTRLYFYAGKSYVKCHHTFIEGRVEGNGNNDYPNQVATDLDRAGLRLKPQLDSPVLIKLRGSENTVHEQTLPSGDSVELIQRRLTDWRVPMSYEARTGSTILESGLKAAKAWLDVSDSRWGVAAGTRYFWQKNPQRLHANSAGILRVEFPSQKYRIYQAMGLAEEVTFFFHKGGTSVAEIAAVMEGFSKDPLFAAAPPSWNISSGAFGEIPPYPAPPPYERYDQVMDDSYSETTAFIREGKAYGLLNYLDMPVDRWGAQPNPDETGWGNSYYDAPGTQIREFARRSEIRWLRDLAFPQIQHFYTTDMYDTDAGLYPGTGDYQNGISGARGAYHRAAWTGEYHYMESLWLYYYLTGDRRALERGYQAAETFAYHFGWSVASDWSTGSPGLGTRHISQKFSTMLEAFLATGDSSLKSALDTQMEDYLSHMLTPEGFVVTGYTHGNPYDADQGWMVLILLHDTVHKYYKLTGNALARNFLITTADRIARYNRVSRQPGTPGYFDFYTNLRISVQAGGFTVQPLFPNDNSDDYFYDSGKLALATALARASDVQENLTFLNQGREILEAVLPNWYGTVFDKPQAQQALRAMHGIALLSAAGAPEADSDQDGLSDTEEVDTYGTDPADSDSDDDGLSDGEEIQSLGTDPKNQDSDRDSVDDLLEVLSGTNPTDSASLSASIYENAFDSPESLDSLSYSGEPDLRWTLSAGGLESSGVSSDYGWAVLERNLARLDRFLIAFDIITNARTGHLLVFGVPVQLNLARTGITDVSPSYYSPPFREGRKARVLLSLTRSGSAYSVKLWVNGKFIFSDLLQASVSTGTVAWSSPKRSGTVLYDNILIREIPSRRLLAAPFVWSFSQGWGTFFKGGNRKVRWKIRPDGALLSFPTERCTGTSTLRLLEGDIADKNVIFQCRLTYLGAGRQGGLWLGYPFDINPKRFACRDLTVQKTQPGLTPSTPHDIALVLTRNSATDSSWSLVVDGVLKVNQEPIQGPARNGFFGLMSGNCSTTSILYEDLKVHAVASGEELPPVLLPVRNRTTAAGSVLSIRLDARSTHDLAARIPSGYTSSADSSQIPAVSDAGLFEWIPTPADQGTHEITFCAAGDRQSACETITVTVTP